MGQSGIINLARAYPTVATSFPTDSGTAGPLLNILSVLGGTSTSDDSDGIRTTGAGSVVTVQLTNRLTGTGSTIGAATADIVTFSLGASTAIFRFVYQIVGRDTGTGDGVGYTITATFKTDGAIATRINTPFSEDDESASLVASGVDMVASGNNAILRTTGTAAQTISWKAVGEYITV
ncbi:MAG TPA: hypothetical protein VJ327_01690 [Patescibacteria group bacterium]|nr:hypothetical protein [Patescibacteria group bacterium]